MLESKYKKQLSHASVYINFAITLYTLFVPKLENTFSFKCVPGKKDACLI